jgi:hypothetical protein
MLFSLYLELLKTFVIAPVLMLALVRAVILGYRAVA